MNENEIVDALLRSVEEAIKSAEKTYASFANNPKNGKELKKAYYLFSEKIISSIKSADELCLTISDAICETDNNNKTDAVSLYGKQLELAVDIRKIYEKYLSDVENAIEREAFELSTFLDFTNTLIRKLSARKKSFIDDYNR